MAAIKGISKSSLWNTWKLIRKELSNASIRDVIDFADYDIDPDKWIKRLLDQISSDSALGNRASIKKVQIAGRS
jgi:hypothetical protein